MSCRPDECWVTAGECHIHPYLTNPALLRLTVTITQGSSHSFEQVLNFLLHVASVAFLVMDESTERLAVTAAWMNCLNAVGNPATYCLASQPSMLWHDKGSWAWLMHSLFFFILSTILYPTCQWDLVLSLNVGWMNRSNENFNTFLILIKRNNKTFNTFLILIKGNNKNFNTIK